MPKRPGKAHHVPAEGPAVFVPRDPTKGQVVPLMLDGTRIGSVRLPGVQAPRDLTENEYLGQPEPPKGDAA